MSTERFETVIIGGGQAGLTTGYHLGKRGREYVILDAFERVGDAWRNGRWDSMRLFTPARYDGMPGWPYPASRHSFPTKDEYGDYMAAYAQRFEIPVRTGHRVGGLSKDGDRFVVTAGDRRFEADNVVIASGADRIPKTPAFAAELDPATVQMHSSEYLRPSQLRDGDVLVVGVGNSGAEISLELSLTGRRVFLSGKESGQIPFRHGGSAAKFAFPLVRFVGHHVLTLRTPIGRKGISKMRRKADPLIRVRRQDLAAAGVERVARTAGIRDGSPLLEDGRVMDVTNVIWCTGYRQDFAWVDLPIFDADGLPIHERGVVPSMPGIYFVGQPFQFSASSDTLPSRGRDAEYVARRIASRARSGRRTEPAGAERAIA